jgi:hypothetical protein
VNVTLQGSTRTPPCAGQSFLTNGVPSIEAGWVAPIGVTGEDGDPLHPAKIAAEAATANKVRMCRAESEDVATWLLLLVG